MLINEKSESENAYDGHISWEGNSTDNGAYCSREKWDTKSTRQSFKDEEC